MVSILILLFLCFERFTGFFVIRFIKLSLQENTKNLSVEKLKMERDAAVRAKVGAFCISFPAVSCALWANLV
jgi:hypothetical protein